tara:strand:+ start:1116 stop:1937 length:822 start_codon:yes stop_codon:yes gene_type:complete
MDYPTAHRFPERKNEMKSNNVRQNWYSEHRRKVLDKFKKGKPDRSTVRSYDSPSGNYKVIVTPVSWLNRSKTKFYYTTASIFKDGKEIFTTHRNSSDFPFGFIENWPDGNDYFMFAEDLQGRSVLNLTTGKCRHYISEKAQRGIEFSWSKMHPTPNGKYLAVEGNVKHKPKDLLDNKEIRFYKLDDIYDLPYDEVGERYTEYYDTFVSWTDDLHYSLDKKEERRYNDDMSIQHMSDEERTKSLQDDEIRIKKVTYNIPLFEGVREEVYSEWID